MASSVRLTSKNFHEVLKTVREELDRCKALASPLARFQFVGRSAATIQQIEGWLCLHDYTVVRPSSHQQCLDVLMNQNGCAEEQLLQKRIVIPKLRRLDESLGRHEKQRAK